MDAKRRKKIGILFISDDIGVIYYLTNIIRSLKFLPEVDKPFVRVYFTPACAKHLILIDYEGAEFVEVTLSRSLFNYVKSIIQSKNFVLDCLTGYSELDGLFPFNDFPGKKPLVSTPLISWIPDFQHKFYPQFFTKKNLFLREMRFKSIVSKADGLIVSSNDAFSHLKAHYLYSPRVNVTVLQFVSMIKNHQLTEFSEVRKRYSLDLPFFLVSNQFYEHKNHLVVLEAIKLLRDKNYRFNVVFSGKTEDYRNPKFFPSLLKYIELNELSNYVKIVGLIPRADQLSMLVNALAVIQPSRFEGWSTIIEDAKTLKRQVICSSLPVHFEQLGELGFYFDVDAAQDLVENMKLFLDNSSVNKEFPDDYDIRVVNFARTFLSAF